jgi:TRAP transporter TAXI family solute receptor
MVEEAKAVNEGTVGIVIQPGDLYYSYARDMSAILDRGSELRVVPIIGKNYIQNVFDLLYLRGVDLTFVHSDVLTLLEQKGAGRNLNQRIHYLAKLFDEQIHLLVSEDIHKISDLNGRKVNVGSWGSGAYISSTVIFRELGIEITPFYLNREDAIAELSNGAIDAALIVSAKPNSLIKELTRESGIKLLPISNTEELSRTYMSAMLTSEDYPELIATDENFETLAIGLMLASFNFTDPWRKQKLNAFITAFTENWDKFQISDNPKWKETNLLDEVPGWNRSAAVAAWVEKERLMAADELDKQKKQLFAIVGDLIETMTPEERLPLLQELLERRKLLSLQEQRIRERRKSDKEMTAAAESAPAGKSGEEVYQSNCVACHATGHAGAPKPGDKESWGARADQGLAVLVNSAINGKGRMPRKGGLPALTDEEIQRAVQYMLEQTGLTAN